MEEGRRSQCSSQKARQAPSESAHLWLLTPGGQQGHRGDGSALAHFLSFQVAITSREAQGKLSLPWKFCTWTEDRDEQEAQPEALGE